MAAADFNWDDPSIHTGPDGQPWVPNDRSRAEARLNLLNATPAVVDALLDPRHPQHLARVQERSALNLVIARGEYSPPVSPDATNEARRFTAGIETRVNADLAAARAKERGQR